MKVAIQEILFAPKINENPRFISEQGKSGFQVSATKLLGLIRQHQNAKLIFGKNLQKRSKIEKVNIIAYSN